MAIREGFGADEYVYSGSLIVSTVPHIYYETHGGYTYLMNRCSGKSAQISFDLGSTVTSPAYINLLISSPSTPPAMPTNYHSFFLTRPGGQMRKFFGPPQQFDTIPSPAGPGFVGCYMYASIQVYRHISEYGYPEYGICYWGHDEYMTYEDMVQTFETMPELYMEPVGLGGVASANWQLKISGMRLEDIITESYISNFMYDPNTTPTYEASITCGAASIIRTGDIVGATTFTPSHAVTLTAENSIEEENFICGVSGLSISGEDLVYPTKTFLDPDPPAGPPYESQVIISTAPGQISMYRQADYFGPYFHWDNATIVNNASYTNSYALRPYFVNLIPQGFLTDYDTPINPDFDILGVQKYESGEWVPLVINTETAIQVYQDTTDAINYSGYRFYDPINGNKPRISVRLNAAWAAANHMVAGSIDDYLTLRTMPLNKPLNSASPWWGVHPPVEVSLLPSLNVWPSQLHGSKGLTITEPVNEPVTINVPANSNAPLFTGTYATRWPYRLMQLINHAYDAPIDFKWSYTGPNKSDDTDLPGWKSLVPREDEQQWSEYNTLQFTLIAPYDTTIDFTVYYTTFICYWEKAYDQHGSLMHWSAWKFHYTDIGNSQTYSIDVVEGTNNIELDLALPNSGDIPSDLKRMQRVSRFTFEFPSTDTTADVWAIDSTTFNLVESSVGEPLKLTYRTVKDATLNFAAVHNGRDVLELARSYGIFSDLYWDFFGIIYDMPQAEVKMTDSSVISGSRTLEDLVTDINTQAGWIATYTDPTETVQNKDSEGNYLVQREFKWSDQRVEFDINGVPSDVFSPGVTDFSIASGPRYDIFIEAVMQGGIHGIVKNATQTARVKNSKDCVHLYEWVEATNTWIYVDAYDTDENGYYRIPGLKPWEYSLGHKYTIVFDNPWLPTGSYTEGRIDTYENVDCSGTCDQFMQRFYTQTFGVTFPQGWYNSTLGLQIEHLPAGCTWIVPADNLTLQPGDALLYFVTPSLAHIVIVHSVDGDTFTCANTNHLSEEFPTGDLLGYFETKSISALGTNLIGWIRFITDSIYDSHLMIPRHFKTVNSTLPIPIEYSMDAIRCIKDRIYAVISNGRIIQGVWKFLTKVWETPVKILDGKRPDLLHNVKTWALALLYQKNQQACKQNALGHANVWQNISAYNIQGKYPAGFMTNKRLYAVARTNQDYLRFYIYDSLTQERIYAKDIAICIDSPGALYQHPEYRYLLASVPTDTGIDIYCSYDEGLNWKFIKTILGTYCTFENNVNGLAVCIYTLNNTYGSTGVLSYELWNGITFEVKTSTPNIGLSDTTKCSIVITEGRIHIIGLRTGTWILADQPDYVYPPGVSLVEYTSTDSGLTFQLTSTCAAI